METQTQLSRHNIFISAENIVGIFSVLSDDSFYMLWQDGEYTNNILRRNKYIMTA